MAIINGSLIGVVEGKKGKEKCNYIILKNKLKLRGKATEEDTQLSRCFTHVHTHIYRHINTDIQA